MSVLAPSAAAIGLALAGIAALGDLRAHLVLFVTFFGLAFAAYLGATWRVLRPTPSASGARLAPILACAAVFRLLLLFSPPTLSDDLYRYVWEGRVLLAGASPYVHAPSDPLLTPLRDESIWPNVNNPDVPSPYPPIAQLGGMIAAALTPHGTLGMKLISLTGDIGVVGALLLLLRRLNAPAERVLVYAWHPLTVLEFAHSAHNDSLMLAPLVLALALVAAGPSTAPRRWGAALLVGAAALAKVAPLLLLPFLTRRLGLVPVVAAVLVVAGALAPFVLLGGAAAGATGGTGSIATYLGSWQDNDSLHAILRELAGATAAKLITLACLAAGIVLVAVHPTLRWRPVWWQTYVVLGLSIVLASTVHAWYLIWLLPLLAVHLTVREHPPFIAPWPGLAWLLLSGLVVLPYLTYDTHRWQLWISFAEYVPFYVLLMLAIPATARRALRLLRVPWLIGPGALAKWSSTPPLPSSPGYALGGPGRTSPPASTTWMAQTTGSTSLPTPESSGAGAAWTARATPSTPTGASAPSSSIPP